ncbi:MAG: Gfo/Idh/MocA family oxidoreductase [Gemmataceae bacterium]|nr:Gfo/Idh/MocA family oxidoreductase [Gemmataceae bacterium]
MFTRRRFLGAALALPAISYARVYGANDKLAIAGIGVGGRGASNMSGVKGENIVAVCDVDANAMGKAAETYNRQARKTNDFRKLFDHANEFDAVVVSTCEHTHAFATLAALKLGKHVYCEKPLTHNVYEARVIREAAAKTKLATQMGTQIHATDNYRRVVELVQAGAVGGVTECHVWVGRTWGRQSADDAKKYKDIVHVEERPTEDVVPPPTLDWDLWIGPAPMRKFNPIYVPGPKWYRWWDFGNGTMSDLGSHWNDLPFWALKLKAPLTIEGSGPPPHAEIAPATMSATYTYGPREGMPALTLTWHQGQSKPPQVTDGTIPKWDSGVLFVGDKGMLLSDYGKHVLLPETRFKDYKRPEPSIPKSLGHYAEWIHACKTGSPTTCNFEYAGWLTEANHLGNVAFRAGKKLEWDAAAMKATNCPAADQFLRREYRKGWTLG